MRTSDVHYLTITFNLKDSIGQLYRNSIEHCPLISLHHPIAFWFSMTQNQENAPLENRKSFFNMTLKCDIFSSSTQCWQVKWITSRLHLNHVTTKNCLYLMFVIPILGHCNIDPPPRRIDCENFCRRTSRSVRLSLPRKTGGFRVPWVPAQCFVAVSIPEAQFTWMRSVDRNLRNSLMQCEKQANVREGKCRMKVLVARSEMIRHL